MLGISLPQWNPEEQASRACTVNSAPGSKRNHGSKIGGPSVIMPINRARARPAPWALAAHSSDAMEKPVTVPQTTPNNSNSRWRSTSDFGSFCSLSQARLPGRANHFCTKFTGLGAAGATASAEAPTLQTELDKGLIIG